MNTYLPDLMPFSTTWDENMPMLLKNNTAPYAPTRIWYTWIAQNHATHCEVSPFFPVMCTMKENFANCCNLFLFSFGMWSLQPPGALWE